MKQFMIGLGVVIFFIILVFGGLSALTLDLF